MMVKENAYKIKDKGCLYIGHLTSKDISLHELSPLFDDEADLYE